MIDVALRKISFLVEILFRFSGDKPHYERMNQRGFFPCALKFEDAMLVVTCDVFFISETLDR